MFNFFHPNTHGLIKGDKSAANSIPAHMNDVSESGPDFTCRSSLLCRGGVSFSMAGSGREGSNLGIGIWTVARFLASRPQSIAEERRRASDQQWRNIKNTGMEKTIRCDAFLAAQLYEYTTASIR